MTPSNEPPSRRERPAKPALTRDGIVRAALAIARADGLEKVTMRRVAEQLDTGAASLYVYVRNTADLRAAMLDEILATVDLSPATAAGPWRQRLAEVLTSYSLVLFANPALAQSAMASRPSGPNYLSLIECLLTLLKAGGVPDDQAAWGVDLLMLYATGIAAEQGRAIGPDGRRQSTTTPWWPCCAARTRRGTRRSPGSPTSWCPAVTALPGGSRRSSRASPPPRGKAATPCRGRGSRREDRPSKLPHRRTLGITMNETRSGPTAVTTQPAAVAGGGPLPAPPRTRCCCRPCCGTRASPRACCSAWFSSPPWAASPT